MMPRAQVFRTGASAALTVLVLAWTASPAGATHVAPLDWCVGVDHPPFEMDYPGDGFSYLRVGVTVQPSLGEQLRAILTGNGRTVEAGEPVDDTGRAVMDLPLYSYGDYELVTEIDGHPLFTEQVTVGPEEPPCGRAQLDEAPAEEAEPSPEAPPEIVVPETVGEEPPIEEELREPPGEPAEDEDVPIGTAQGEPAAATAESELPWSILIGGGLALGLAGLLVARGGPCDEERRAWEQAKRAEQEAAAEAERAREAAAEATAQRQLLDEQLEEIREQYPDAGKPGGDDAWVEIDGRRITARDVRMRRAAERAAWERYRADPNPDTARELMDDWKESDTPEAEAERREVDARASDLQRRRDEAADGERTAKRRADDAEEARRRAGEATAAAHAAYQECLGKASAASGGGTGATDGTEEGPGEAGGGVAVGTGPAGEPTRERGCPEGEEKEENVTVLATVKMPIRVNVELSGGDAHQAAMAARDISAELAEISERLGWLSLAMDIKGIGSKLVLDKSGWQALGDSVAPLSGAASGAPVPTSPGQAVVDYVRTVANIASVIIAKVPELQARRLPDCDVTCSITYRWLRVSCADLLRCEGGTWVPDGKRFTITVQREGSGGQRRETALTWAQAQVEIGRWDDRFTRDLVKALEDLEQARRRCGAGS